MYNIRLVNTVFDIMKKKMLIFDTLKILFSSKFLKPHRKYAFTATLHTPIIDKTGGQKGELRPGAQHGSWG